MFKNLLAKDSLQAKKNNFYHLPKAVVANIFNGFPTKKLTVIGVTGTDGKTTTTNMIYQMLKAAGKKVSVISTINAVIGGKVYDTGFHVTSPESFMVQKFARMAKKNKDEFLVLEVTSHALDQYRFWGIKFDIGVITNITHEHLDYHKTLERYKATKLKLIKNSKYAVINKNIEGVKNIKGKLITFGLENGDFNQKDLKLSLKIPGNYNIENALATMAVGFVLNIDRKIAQKSVENFEGLNGRMEEIKNKFGIKVVIDFAHTPNALENALKTLKDKLNGGKLIAVFGAAGSRDSLKRSMMGFIAGKLSDITVLTDEDPRFEDSNKIIDEISAGAYQQGLKDNINLFKEPNREKAIKLAISLAKKGDTIGIFGKGHEQSMNYKGKEISWSDKKVVERLLDGQ